MDLTQFWSTHFTWQHSIDEYMRTMGKKKAKNNITAMNPFYHTWINTLYNITVGDQAERTIEELWTGRASLEIPKGYHLPVFQVRDSFSRFANISPRQGFVIEKAVLNNTLLVWAPTIPIFPMTGLLLYNYLRFPRTKILWISYKGIVDIFTAPFNTSKRNGFWQPRNFITNCSYSKNVKFKFVILRT